MTPLKFTTLLMVQTTWKVREIIRVTTYMHNRYHLILSLSLSLSSPQYHSPKLSKKTSPQTWHKGKHREILFKSIFKRKTKHFPCANSCIFFALICKFWALPRGHVFMAQLLLLKEAGSKLSASNWVKPIATSTPSIGSPL